MSSRTTALNTIIEMALGNEEITVKAVEEKSGISTSTVKRALYEAEDYGWVTKQSKRSNYWQRGEIAREYSNGYNAEQFQTEKIPHIYFVYSGESGASEYMVDERILLSAGVSWMESGAGFSVSPDFEPRHLAIDSGGYQAALHFKQEYPYSAKQYHRWAEDIEADVVFGMDWACEDRDVLIENTQRDVSEDELLPWKTRWKKSVKSQIKQYNEHQSGNYSHHFVPVLQGQDPDHFVQNIKEFEKHSIPMDYASIGTVCKRDSSENIYKVLRAVTDELGHKRVHLFGATLNIWKNEKFSGSFMSSDSAAWLRHDPEVDGMFPESEERAFKNYKQKVQETYVYKNR